MHFVSFCISFLSNFVASNWYWLENCGSAGPMFSFPRLFLYVNVCLPKKRCIALGLGRCCLLVYIFSCLSVPWPLSYIEQHCMIWLLLGLWCDVMKFSLTWCTELIALHFAPVRFSQGSLLFLFFPFLPLPPPCSSLLPLPLCPLPLLFVVLFPVPRPLVSLSFPSFPVSLFLLLPLSLASPVFLLFPSFPFLLSLSLLPSLFPFPYLSARSFWEASRKLNLYLIIVKLWIVPVLLTEMLHLWLVPDPWSTFLFGVVQTYKTMPPVVLDFHRINALHKVGTKALVAYNLPRDYLWHRILNRFLQDKLALLNIVGAYLNKVALSHKTEDTTQAMEHLLLLDLMYMVLDLGVWHPHSPLLHLRGLQTSFLDKFLANFDHHHLD